MTLLRAVSRFCCEGQALEALARRDGYKLFRSVHTAAHSHNTLAAASQTVLTSAAEPPAPAPTPPAARAAPPPPPPPPPRRSWVAIAATLALTSSLGGVYYYNKIRDSSPQKEVKKPASAERTDDEEGELYPATGSSFPQHVDFLVVGGGTAAFAALRALRAARPEASLMLVGAERAPPYMRPPLSKELWRRPDLPQAAEDPLSLAFTQYNGKQRRLVYEPLSFYTPLERLKDGGGAGLARGWRVTSLDLTSRSASLRAPGLEPVTVSFDKCLLATGSVAKRLPALAPAAAAGRSLALHSVRDVARLARLLQDASATGGRVAVVGAGLLAAELSAALAERLRGGGVRVVQLCRERAPLEELLPAYLAADAGARLRALGVELMPEREIESCTVRDGRVHMKLKRAEGGETEEPQELVADVVVECVGAEPAVELAEGAGLELHPQLGGFVVNAELQARAGVWAAGDAACFHDVTLGRRRVTHHDHAVLSGRRAAQNMAGAPEPYTHQSMFWSDLGPQLGYEAIGIVDSSLPTVGVFSSDAVTDAAATAVVSAGTAENGAEEHGTAEHSTAEHGTATDARRYERGVVFYMRERRVVGVLLWNLFNRMHVARQVLAQGEFEDLFEVAKLFAPHEED